MKSPILPTPWLTVSQRVNGISGVLTNTSADVFADVSVGSNSLPLPFSRRSTGF